MFGVEIDLIVSDCLKALSLYESIFEVERIEVTSYEQGLNEAIFTMYGTRFHMLDENPEYQMFAPKPDCPKSVWFNVVVPDISDTFTKAVNAGCTIVQPINEMPELGVKNALFTDMFGYLWMLHEIFREVSFEERKKIMEEKMMLK